MTKGIHELGVLQNSAIGAKLRYGAGVRQLYHIHEFQPFAEKILDRSFNIQFKHQIAHRTLPIGFGTPNASTEKLALMGKLQLKPESVDETKGADIFTQSFLDDP